MKRLFLVTILLFIIGALFWIAPIKTKAVTYNVIDRNYDTSKYYLQGVKGSKKWVSWHVLRDPITRNKIYGYCVETGTSIDNKNGYTLVNMNDCTSAAKCGPYYNQYKKQAGKFTAILNHSVKNISAEQVKKEFNNWCLNNASCKKDLYVKKKKHCLSKVDEDSIRTATQRVLWAMQKGDLYPCYGCDSVRKKVINNLSNYFNSLPAEATTTEVKPSIIVQAPVFKNKKWVVKYTVDYKTLKSGSTGFQCRKNDASGEKIDNCEQIKTGINSYELIIPNRKIYWEITAQGLQTSTSSRGAFLYYKKENQNFLAVGYAKYPDTPSSVSQNGTIVPQQIPCEPIPETKPMTCDDETANGIFSKGYPNETIEGLLGEDKDQYLNANECEAKACSGDVCCNTTIDILENNINNFTGNENGGFGIGTWVKFVTSKIGVTACSDYLAKIKIVRTCYSKTTKSCVSESKLKEEASEVKLKFKYKQTSKSDYVFVDLEKYKEENNYEKSEEKDYCKSSYSTTISYKLPKEQNGIEYSSPDGCQGFEIKETPDPVGKIDLEIKYEDKTKPMEENKECKYPSANVCKVEGLCNDKEAVCDMPCKKISTVAMAKEHCDCPCEGEECKSAQYKDINYRTISLTDVFPNNRTPDNTNWSTAVANNLLTKIENKYQISDADKIYSGTPEYSVTLTAQNMKTIRDYNAYQEKNATGYFDNSLVKGSSQYLKDLENTYGIKVERNGDQ